MYCLCCPTSSFECRSASQNLPLFPITSSLLSCFTNTCLFAFFQPFFLSAGTNADIASKLLKESGMAIHTATSMDEAAKKVTSLL